MTDSPEGRSEPIGPLDPLTIPRFAGPSTFARLPRREDVGARAVAGRIHDRVADAPVYVSIDIDVLDPAFAPGTGTPEAGGMTSRELLGTLRGLAGVNLVGADIVEVAPPYDNAEVTAVAGAPP